MIAGEMREHDFSQISTACWLSDFQKDGYLLIRNAIPASNVAQARETLITEFGAAATSAPPLLGNRNAYSHPHLLHPVLEHPNLFKICQTLLIHASTTTFIPFPFKWLRAVKTDLYTVSHYPPPPSLITILIAPLRDHTLIKSTFHLFPHSSPFGFR